MRLNLAARQPPDAKKLHKWGGNRVDSSKNENTTQIVIVHYDHSNKGTEAMLITTMDSLQRFISNVSFTVFMHGLDPSAQKEFPDVSFYEALGFVASYPKGLWAGLRTVPPLIKCALWRIFRGNNFAVQVLANDERLKAYYNADVILTIGGDTLTEDYGSFGLWSNVLNLLFGLLLDKPVVIYAESIGPFKRRYNKIIVRFLLKRAKLITLREKASEQTLFHLHISNPAVFLTADSAFLLESASLDRVKEICNNEGLPADRRPVIGITPSYLIPRYGSDRLLTPQESYGLYVKLMSQIADYLADSLNAIVLLIPHVIHPPSVYSIDDRSVANDIYQMSRRRDCIFAIKGEYSAEETKGIEGICDLFVSSRMHAAIAATSLAIPTIVIAYSHKTHGIIGEMLGCRQYVFDITELSYESLISAICTAWMNRAEIKEELNVRMGTVKQKALKNAELVAELIEQEKARS